jgi:anti-sigma B factor antagonist
MCLLPNTVDVRLTDDGIAVVSPTGELDLSRATPLRAALERALAIGFKAVHVDLGAVTFVDSTALAAVVEAWRHATRREVGFKLTDPAPNVRRVLEITDLDRLVDEADLGGGRSPQRGAAAAAQLGEHDQRQQAGGAGHDRNPAELRLIGEVRHDPVELGDYEDATDDEQHAE